MTLHVKMAMPDLQRYPWNLDLIKNEEENIVFSHSKSDYFCEFLHCILLYRCKSGIAILAKRVIWSLAYSPFNLYLELEEDYERRKHSDYRVAERRFQDYRVHKDESFEKNKTSYAKPQALNLR